MVKSIRTASASLVCAIVLSAPCVASDWVEDDRDVQIQEHAELTAPAVSPAGSPAVAEPIAATTGLVSELSSLEMHVFGKAYQSDSLLKRLADLEQSVLQQSDPELPFDDRISRLRRTIEQQKTPDPAPTATAPPKAPKRNWFLDPAPMPMMDALGHGLKNAGRGVITIPRATAEGGKHILTSPLFWGAAAAGGAAVGGYYLLKNTNLGAGGYYSSDPYASSGAYTSADPYYDDLTGAPIGGDSDSYASVPGITRGLGGGSKPLDPRMMMPRPSSFGAYRRPSLPMYQPTPFRQSPGITLGDMRMAPQKFSNATAPFRPSTGSAFGGTGSHYVSGYTRRNGTYVSGYHQTNRNNTMTDNWSTRGMTNLYTGKRGSRTAKY